MLTELNKKLGYTFKNPTLLKEALTHRSLRGSKNNERLEFLGDAILNFLITTIIFKHHPRASEGELSRLRASLVREESLTELAHQFNLSQYLLLGAGEIRSGGLQRSSILSDAIEAIIGAIYLDSDLAECERCIQQWFSEKLSAEISLTELKDAKSNLQEYTQAHKMPLPVYNVISVEGAAHQQTFEMECRIEGVSTTTQGKGNNRRQAEQQAAAAMLLFLNSGK